MNEQSSTDSDHSRMVIGWHSWCSSLVAVAVMAGLTFGTVITMVVVPVLYTIFYKVPSPVMAR